MVVPNVGYCCLIKITLVASYWDCKSISTKNKFMYIKSMHETCWLLQSFDLFNDKNLSVAFSCMLTKWFISSHAVSGCLCSFSCNYPTLLS